MNLLGMKPSKGRDLQKQRVYDFEDRLVANGTISMRPISKANCKELIDHVMTEFGMEHVPVVVSWFEHEAAQCTVNRIKGTVHINLPRVYRRTIWVLHEISHALGASDHGPRFLSAYFMLLDTYLGIDFDALKEAAENFTTNGRKTPLKVGLKRFAPKRVKRSTKLQMRSIAA